MGTQTAPLQHHLPAAKFGHFQEIRRRNNKHWGKTRLVPLLSSSSNPSGGATSLMLCPWQGVPNVPRGRHAHNDGQRGQAAPPLPGSHGSLPWVNFSTEPQRATIILLTAREVFPDCWTRFLSLRIGKNLQSSKNGFQRALQVILKP